jgi:predicted house-cleaning noncanonical NTP pyrophosphatase (MazG superfamily)
MQERARLVRANANLDALAFVIHRFIAARSSAWARAEPDNPTVEIHGLWGLPDGLQFFPYDTWEVHVPTGTATENTDYKSNILVPRDSGEWEFVRVRNDLARNLSISQRDAVEMANRSLAAAKRIGKSCHIMWFVGCADVDGKNFNMPWYWVPAHEEQVNIDRANYAISPISSPADLVQFENKRGSRHRQAIELRPTDVDLMRDNDFIDSVGATARRVGVPVIFHGSTLAHAFYQLRRQGCSVITRGEKDHSRVRRSETFGKIVRDKIPDRIASRREAEVTRQVPSELTKGFLTSKLIEEALELRRAATPADKTAELADLIEVVRGLAKAEGISFDSVVTAADQKRDKVGGFDQGQVLIQTGIVGRKRTSIRDGQIRFTALLARKVDPATCEFPFSFLGFTELDQPRSILFPGFGIRLTFVLKADRIQMQVSRADEQLSLPFEQEQSADDEQ